MTVISSLAGGGAERSVSLLSGTWVEAGDDVRVVTISSSERDVYELDARVSRGELNLERKSRGAMGAFWNSVLRLSRLRREIRNYDPDVIVAFMPPASILSGVAALGLRARVIGCERTYPPMAPLGQMREAARYFAYGLLDSVTAQTSETAAWLRRRTLARNVAVIPNPAIWPLPEGSPVVAPEGVCRPGRRILLAVGRLEAEKGFGDLLEVFSGMRSRCPDWDLVVVGEGSLRSQLEAVIAEHQLHGRVFLPGRVGNIADWYARASLFVMTSTFEGFPNALVEALAHGVPSVSYDCDAGPRDILRDGVDGVLVPSGKRQALEAALHSLMANDGLRQQMAERAVEIRERLSPSKIANQWGILLGSLVSGRPNQSL